MEERWPLITYVEVNCLTRDVLALPEATPKDASRDYHMLDMP